MMATVAEELKVRVGIPHAGGGLVAAARDRGYPVLFSANAFACTHRQGTQREGEFRKFRLPDPEQFEGLDAALDSAGFVAAVRYGDYRWGVEDYVGLAASHRWAWWAAMDYCCEPEIAKDRPLRILRMAATAWMLGQCNKEARRQGIAPAMPVLQGWTPAEYAQCAEWLPLLEWPELVGVGSVCRRDLHGPTGLLAIIEALDAILPRHVRLHLFGVKSAALERLAGHPRVASTDSMAWDVTARRERPTGRDLSFRIECMDRWATRQQSIGQGAKRGIQSMLFDPLEFGGLSSWEDRVLEALAYCYADLVLGGEVDYREAVGRCAMDGVHCIAIVRREGQVQDALGALEEIFPGMCEKLESGSDGFEEGQGRVEGWELPMAA